MTSYQLNPPKMTSSLMKLLTHSTQILTHISHESKRGSLKNPIPHLQKEDILFETKGAVQSQIPDSKPSEVKIMKRPNGVPSRKISSGGLTPHSITRSTLITPKSTKNEDLTPYSKDRSKTYSKSSFVQENSNQIKSKRTNTKRSSLSKIHKKSLLDFSAYSGYSEKIDKSRNSRRKDTLENEPGKESPESFLGEKLPLASIMRRKSCHCTDCGNISKLEKKHLNLNIQPRRTQERKNVIFLSLRSSVDWSTPKNGRPSTDYTPITRVSRPSLDYSPLLNSPASSISSSKRTLTVALNWDKAPSHLSKFASKKKSFTMHTENDGQIESKLCLEDDAEGDEDRPTILKSLKNTNRRKGKEIVSRSSVDGVQIPLDGKRGSVGRLGERLLSRGKSLKIPVSKGATASSLESSDDDNDDSHSVIEEKPEHALTKTDKNISKSKTMWKIKNLSILETKSSSLRTPKTLLQTLESPKREGNYFAKGFGSATKQPKANSKTKKKIIMETYTSLSPMKSSHLIRKTLNSSNSVRLKEPYSAFTLSNQPSLYLLSPKRLAKQTQSFNTISSVREGLPSAIDSMLPVISSRTTKAKTTSPKEKQLISPTIKPQTEVQMVKKKKREFSLTMTAIRTERESTINKETVASLNRNSMKIRHKKNAPSLLLPEELKKIYRQVGEKATLSPNKSAKQIFASSKLL